MKRKHTPKNQQNIVSFFAKKSPPNSPLTHPTPQNQPVLLSNEHNPAPQNEPPTFSNETVPTIHQASEQQSSPSHNSFQNSPHASPENEHGHSCPLKAPAHGERLSESDFANLPQDPGKRRKMSEFHPDDRDGFI